MNYKFVLTLPKRDDFKCEIAIDSDQTFDDLSNIIAQVLHFDPANMPVFFTLDDDGNRKREISMFGFGDADDENSPLVMSETAIRKVINPSCMEFVYVYDVPLDEYIKIEYDGGYFGDDDEVMPKCLSLTGRIPVIKSLVKAFINKRGEENLDSLFPNEPPVERGGRDNDDDIFDEVDDIFDEDIDDGSTYTDEFDEFGGSNRTPGATFESLDNYLDSM